jgi:hypothetical protein
MGISGGVTKLETMISIFWTLANTSNRKKTVVILWRCSCSPPFASGTFGLVGSHKKSLKMFCAVQSLSNTSLKSLLVFPSPSFVASTSLGQTCFPIPGFAGFHARDAGRNDEEHWGAERGHDGQETGYGAMSFHIPSNWTFVRFDWV